MNTERELLDSMVEALRKYWMHGETIPNASSLLAQYDALPPATADAPAKVGAVELIAQARAWFDGAPHGDNCFVSDHYEGDPGNRCNCGRDSLERAFEEYDENPQTQPSAATAVNTAEGDDALALLALRTFYGEPADQPLDEENECHLFADMQKVVRVIRDALSSPPASASMSAGVTAELVSDVQNILAQTERGKRNPLSLGVIHDVLDAAERARANTRAGVEK